LPTCKAGQDDGVDATHIILLPMAGIKAGPRHDHSATICRNLPETVMAKTISDVTIQRRDVRVALDWFDLQSVIGHMAIMSAGLDKVPNADQVEVEIKIEQETEGSPSYPVPKWKAWVNLTVPLPQTDDQP
jgi:hypothetical protein